MALSLALAIGAAACGDDDSKSSASTTTAATSTPDSSGSNSTAPVDDAFSLKGVCPDKLILQTDWWPEAEHGGAYELIGDGYRIDADKKVVTGPLVASGHDTGIEFEVRAGGSAIAGSVAAEMAAHPEIHFGYVNTEGAATLSDMRLVSVLAPLEANPQIILWNPERYPDVHTIADLKKHNVPVLVFGRGILAKWAVSQGILNDDQFDTSFDGSPARFVATDGEIAMQGFATAEPYTFLHDISDWMKPIAYQTWFDAGFESYSQTIGVRAEDIDTLRPCLAKVVPMMQQAQVDYVTNPTRVNRMILETVEKYATFWTQSEGLMEFSVKAQLDTGTVSNGPDDTLGNMDEARIEENLRQLRAAKLDVPADLVATDLFTNEFIDTSIGLK